MGNFVLAGHSMGATGVIMASQRLGPGVIKAMASQHPGICGPTGPPPRFGNSTWMKFDMAHAMEKFPTLHTTSHSPETPWVLRHLKLYGQMQGSKSSKCFQLLWGDGPESLRQVSNANKVDVHSEDHSTSVVV